MQVHAAGYFQLRVPRRRQSLRHGAVCRANVCWFVFACGLCVQLAFFLFFITANTLMYVVATNPRGPWIRFYVPPRRQSLFRAWYQLQPRVARGQLLVDAYSRVACSDEGSSAIFVVRRVLM